jgi:hypothetical protein
MSEPTSLESVVEWYKQAIPNSQVRQLGESALQVYSRENDALVSWMSNLSVKGFVEKLEVTEDMVPRLIICRTESPAPIVEPSRLIDPTSLSEAEWDGIFLIRDNIDDDSALVFERAAWEEFRDYSHVSARTLTFNKSLAIMERFLPAEAIDAAKSMA